MIDAILNARATRLTSLPYSDSDTVLTLEENDFSDADADFNLVIFDRAAGSPAEARKAGRFEIVRVDHTQTSGDDITVTRGQEGETPIEFDSGGIWEVIMAPTKHVFEQILGASQAGQGVFSRSVLIDDTVGINEGTELQVILSDLTNGLKQVRFSYRAGTDENTDEDKNNTGERIISWRGEDSDFNEEIIYHTGTELTIEYDLSADSVVIRFRNDSTRDFHVVQIETLDPNAAEIELTTDINEYISEPDAPVITGTQSDNEAIRVFFDTPFDGGSAIQGYEYRIDEDDQTITDVGMQSESLLADGLDNNQEYDVQIRAYNAFGESEWSNIEQETPTIQEFVVAGDQDGVLKLVDLDGNEIESTQAHSDLIHAVKISGDVILTASFDNDIKKWDKELNQIGIFTGHSARVYALDADDDYFYSSDNNGVTKKVRISDMQEMWSNDTTLSDRGEDIAVDGNGDVYVGGKDRVIYKLSGTDGNLLDSYDASITEDIRGIAVSPSGHVGFGGDDSTFHLIDSDFNLVYTSSLPNDPRFRSVRYSDELGLFVVADDDRITTYNISSSTPVHDISAYSSNTPIDIAIDGDGAIYIGNFSDELLKLILSSETVAWTFTGFTNRVYAVDATPGKFKSAGL